ncbi:MAG: divergent polysaccharide deacetylase family protein [Alphaproteobacteria bacterium]|nr:divergent polysaccharide deacetylase family protein [Alphaproteobacteria bacterium]
MIRSKKNRGDEAGRPSAGSRAGGLLGAVALALVALVAGVVLWLALSAEDTMQDLQRLAGNEPPGVTLVVPPRPAPADEEAAGEADSAATPPATAAGSGAAAPTRLAGDARWQRFSQPFDRSDSRPRIALVVTHLGLDEQETSRTIAQLPEAITLAFSAYAEGLDDWLPEARAAGHEALLMVPMEPEDYPADDPGPHTLRTVEGPETNLERLDWVLARAEGYVGVMDTYGARFTASAAALRPVLRTLEDRGLAFVDTRASSRSAGLRVAADLGVPRAAVDLRLDAGAAPEAIDIRLLQLEALAQQSGHAVATVEAYPLILDRLQSWAAELEDRGLVLAPITAVLQSDADT